MLTNPLNRMCESIDTDGQSPREALKQILDRRSKAEMSTTYCERCGAACGQIPTQFWFYGEEEEAVTIKMPFCRHCHPDLFHERR